MKQTIEDLAKKKVLFAVILVLASFLVYSFSNPTAENNTTISSSGAAYLLPSPTGGSNYPIGFIQSAGMLDVGYNTSGANFTHWYPNTTDTGAFPRDPDKHTPYDHWINFPNDDYLYSDSIQQQIKDKLQEVYTDHNASRLLLQRPKIEWLAYGQSSTYQAEYLNPSTEDYWFYSFNQHTGYSEPDNEYNNGDYVLHCQQPVDNMGTVLSSLRCNSEQCKSTTSEASNQWMGDSECKWLIKPRIRIDSGYAHNNPSTKIFNIKVIAQDGTTILLNSDIKGINFLDENGNYDGGYIEKYFSHQDNNIDLSVQGDWTNGNNNPNWCYNSRETNQLYNDNKADIQIYWYDNCDIWIDYVKVENDVADRLLKGNDPDFNQWIQDEVSAAMSAVYAKPISYYVELVEFNNLPCLEYVNRKIYSLSNHELGLTYDLLGHRLCRHQICPRQWVTDIKKSK